MVNVSSRRAKFRDLHASGCFVIPNPWDVGSARYLQRLGFQALATTSAGFAFARGVPDGAAPLAEMLEHIGEMVAATDLPVNADFGNGFADAPERVAENVRACIETGVAGLSIEDATGNRGAPLYDFELAVDRMRAARAAIDGSGTGVLLTGRAECYLVRHRDAFEESLRRLRAYGEAGADVLYAPGVTKREEIAAVVEAVQPKPVNLLVSSAAGLTVSEVAEMGVRRISVGSSLARAAWSGFVKAAKEIAENGTFEGFRGLTPYEELNEVFAEYGPGG